MAEFLNEQANAAAAAYACNGQPISSADFYAIACDPRRSVAVEACAGAGKTWMLVSRILRALLEPASRLPAPGESAKASSATPVAPQEILAITFTRKAASEMRQRLGEWLEAFAHASDEQLLHELQIRGLSVNPAAAAAAAAAAALENTLQTHPDSRHQNRLQPNDHLHKQLSNLYRQMLASGRSVQIQTFHGWFAALLRGAPVALLQRLGLPLQYQLLEDDAQARQQVWRPFLAFLAGESGFEPGVAADSAALQASPALLKADFETLVQLHGRSNARKALEAALQKRSEFTLADAAGVVDTSVETLGQLFPQLADFETPADALGTPAARTFWLGIAQTLGRETKNPPKKAAAAIEAAFAVTDLGERLCKLKLALFVKSEDRLIHHLQSYPAAVEAAADLLVLCQATAQQEALRYHQRLTRLARALLAQYAALKHREGWVDMNDVEQAAFAMLSDPVLSGWVQERLDARIRHLMIDEFQDTNPLQWQALSSWLAGYAGAGNRPSVFLVGDPKQSIYRFRRAEPQVFIAAQRFVVEGLGGDLLSCDHTRRNAQAVIGAVNTVFGGPAANGNTHIDTSDFRIHTTASTLSGQVGRLAQIPRFEKEAATDTTSLIWRDSLVTPRELPEETLRTLEAQQAARWIAAQIGSGLKASEVMVLARKRAGLQPLQLALRELHIAAVIGEKTQLIDCCEVQDIVALLDVLVSAPHDLSLARALRSPLFGLPDSALVALALLQQTQRLPWLELLQMPELLPPDVPALALVAPVLLRWKTWLDQLPPHDALQRIYDDGDVLARFAAAAPAVQRSSVLANLRALLAVALNMASGGRYATPYALVRLLKSGDAEAAPATVQDAVQLLTVHGAKGLEAKAVLLLDTDSQKPNTPSMDILIDWPGEHSQPQRFVFMASEKSPPLCAVATLELEQQARLREESNALYVAMTRARETLVVSSIAPHRANPESWWQRLLAVIPPWVSPAVQSLPAHAATGPDGQGATDDTFLLAELPVWRRNPLEDETAAAGLNPAPAAIGGETNELPDTADTAAMAKIQAETDDLSARIGLAMHRLLEWGAPQPTDTLAWPALVESALAAAVFAPQQIAAVAREFRLEPLQSLHAANIAQTILQGDAAWAWQAAALAWQGNEVALVFEGQVLRIDRLVQRADAGHAGHWWVLDYKSALTPQSQPALVAQLVYYRRAVQSAYADAVVKAAFLTGSGRVVELEGEIAD